jgi:hypothetical protein
MTAAAAIVGGLLIAVAIFGFFRGAWSLRKRDDLSRSQPKLGESPSDQADKGVWS